MDQNDVRTGVVDSSVGSIDFARLWAILRTGKWVLLSCVGCAVVLVLLYVLMTRPVFRSDALLQLQEPDASGFSTTNMLRELTGSPSSTADAVVQIIRSRSVLRETVDQLDLTTTAEADYFPLIGYAIARFRSADIEDGATSSDVDAGNWLTNFLWTGGSARIDRFVVPEQLNGVEFTLRALSQTRYALLGPDDQVLLSGVAGEVASGKTAAGDPIEIFVSEITPAGYPSDFTVTKQHWLEAVETLQELIAVAEVGRDSSIVRVSLEGTDPERTTRIVNSIAETYLRQNVEATSEQAEKRLEFLELQLPQLQEDVELSETELNLYRAENHALDLGVEARSLLDQVVDLEQRMSELQLRRYELEQSYTAQHPYLIALSNQMQSLRGERSQLEVAIGELPETQREMLGLQRNVEVNTALYVQLLNNAQELRILRAGTIGNVRIVDSAVVPVEPVKPRPLFLLAAAILIGAFVGVLAAIARAELRSKLVDPSAIERNLGLPIYATIPFSQLLSRDQRNVRRDPSRRRIIPARDHPDELAVEALRSLRTSLHFSQQESGSRTIVITGPSPNAGKSFVSINIAVLLAEGGKRVALVDGDLRKGQLHRYQDGSGTIGLSDILSDAVPIEDGGQLIDDTSVTLFPRGQIAPNPSELLMRPRLGEFFSYLEKEFEYIVVDAPPVLAVTDAAVILSVLPKAPAFMVVRAGVERLSAVEEAARRFSRQQCNVTGVIFNAVRNRDRAADSEHGYYYQYEY